MNAIKYIMGWSWSGDVCAEKPLCYTEMLVPAGLKPGVSQATTSIHKQGWSRSHVNWKSIMWLEKRKKLHVITVLIGNDSQIKMLYLRAPKPFRWLRASFVCTCNCCRALFDKDIKDLNFKNRSLQQSSESLSLNFRVSWWVAGGGCAQKINCSVKKEHLMGWTVHCALSYWKLTTVLHSKISWL